MRLKMHAAGHIVDRTKMSIADVLSILKSEATVKLGTSGKITFFLFYSPPDVTSKVALVDVEEGSLISIWEKNFCFPVGVQRAVPRLERLARERQQEYENRENNPAT